MLATHDRVSDFTVGTLVIVTGVHPPGLSHRPLVGLAGWVEIVHSDTADIRMDKDSTAILDYYDSPYAGDEAECLLPDISLSHLRGR